MARVPVPGSPGDGVPRGFLRLRHSAVKRPLWKPFPRLSLPPTAGTPPLAPAHDGRSQSPPCRWRSGRSKADHIFGFKYPEIVKQGDRQRWPRAVGSALGAPAPVSGADEAETRASEWRACPGQQRPAGGAAGRAPGPAGSVRGCGAAAGMLCCGVRGGAAGPVPSLACCAGPAGPGPLAALRGAGVASLPGCRQRTGGQGTEGCVLVLVPGQGLEQGRRSLADEEAGTCCSLWDSARCGALRPSRRAECRCGVSSSVGMGGVAGAERTWRQSASASSMAH